MLAIVAASIFLIFTKDVEPAATDFELDGTWKLFNYGVPMTDEQYLVFNDGTVNGYKNGNDTISAINETTPIVMGRIILLFIFSYPLSYKH